MKAQYDISENQKKDINFHVIQRVTKDIVVPNPKVFLNSETLKDDQIENIDQT